MPSDYIAKRRVLREEERGNRTLGANENLKILQGSSWSEPDS